MTSQWTYKGTTFELEPIGPNTYNLKRTDSEIPRESVEALAARVIALEVALAESRARVVALESDAAAAREIATDNERLVSERMPRLYNDSVRDRIARNETAPIVPGAAPPAPAAGMPSAWELESMWGLVVMRTNGTTTGNWRDFREQLLSRLSGGRPSVNELARTFQCAYWKSEGGTAPPWEEALESDKRGWLAEAEAALSLFSLTPDRAREAKADSNALDELYRQWCGNSRGALCDAGSREWLRATALSLHDAIETALRATGRLRGGA